MALVANVANIVLDYVFIVRLEMAAYGAGLATSLGQCLMLAAAVAIFLSRYRPRRWSWREVLDRARSITGEEIPARIEARRVYQKLFERYPNMRLPDQELTWRALPFFRGLEQLMVDV